MTSEDLEAWRSQALAVSKPLRRLPLPLDDLLAEAADVAAFTEQYWQPQRDAAGQLIRPGLVQAAQQGPLHAGLAQEIIALRALVSDAHTRYGLAAAQTAAAPRQRANHVLHELKGGLSYLFSERADPDAAACLRSLKAAHRRASSHHALAAALDAFTSLARRERAELARLGRFEPTLIDEAGALAGALREHAALKFAGVPARAAAAALALRNRYATLLLQRLDAVRGAAKYVFRGDELSLAKVRSAYRPRLRKAARRARAQAAHASHRRADSDV